MAIPQTLRQWTIESLQDGTANFVIDNIGIGPGDAAYVMDEFGEDVFNAIWVSTLEMVGSAQDSSTAVACAIIHAAFVGYALRMRREKESN